MNKTIAQIINMVLLKFIQETAYSDNVIFSLFDFRGEQNE